MGENEKWLRMDDLIGRNANNSVWIPLWGYVEDRNESGDVPRRYDECRIYNSLLVPVEKKKEAMRMSLSDLHPMVDRYAVIGKDPYFSAHAERNGYDSVLGTYLVAKRCYVDGGDYAVNIDQDLILDLRLKQEGDKWVRPCEAYCEVIRLSRDKEKKVNLIEIKTEFLKDWLCARKCGIVLVCNLQRRFLSLDGDEMFKKAKRTRIGGGCLESWNYGCDSAGNGVLGDWEVSTFGYEDVDANEDVPVFDMRKDGKKMSSSKRIITAPTITTRMDMSQFVRTEWMPPARKQRRMPFDCDGALPFICEADGRMKSGHRLSYPSRYLWFDNAVLKQIVGMRGGWVRWITQETGLVGFDGGGGVHFGVNRIGRVNVFAKDIAKMVWWQQEIWRAHNVVPDGGVCAELTDAQQRCCPAKTYAPENLLHTAFDQVSLAYSFYTKGDQFFLPFDSMSEVGNSIQRFNVQSKDDVLWLAKQITRLIIETLNQNAFRKLAKVKKDEKIGSLKLLERVLSGITDEKRAYDLMSSLHAIYTLRNADSHIPGKDVADALDALGITAKGQLIRQGGRMIFVAAKALHEIALVFKDAAERKVAVLERRRENGDN